MAAPGALPPLSADDIKGIVFHRKYISYVGKGAFKAKSHIRDAGDGLFLCRAIPHRGIVVATFPPPIDRRRFEPPKERQRLDYVVECQAAKDAEIFFDASSHVDNVFGNYAAQFANDARDRALNQCQFVVLEDTEDKVKDRRLALCLCLVSLRPLEAGEELFVDCTGFVQMQHKKLNALRAKPALKTVDWLNELLAFMYAMSIDLGQHGLSVACTLLTSGEKNVTVNDRRQRSCVLLTESVDSKSLDLVAMEYRYSVRRYNPEDPRHRFCRNYKLYFKDEHLTEDSCIEDIKGHQLPVQKLLTAIFRYIINREHKNMQDKYPLLSLTLQDMYLIVTVPAIWPVQPKKITRQSIHNVGVRPEQLMLALEPEAAAFYMMHEYADKDFFPIGGLMASGDCGSATNDFACLKRVSETRVKHVAMVDGNDLGSSAINRRLIDQWKEICGASLVEKFCREETLHYLKIIDRFEAAKLAFRMDGRVGVHKVEMFNFADYAEADGKCKIQALVDACDKKKPAVMWNNKDKEYRVPYETMGHHIRHVVTETVKTAAKFVRQHDIPVFALVGNFAQSDMLYAMLKEELEPQCRVIRPPNCEHAVVLGALYYGLDPKIIASRISPATYGVVEYRAWNAKLHKDRPKIVVRKAKTVRDYVKLFLPLVKKGDSVDSASFKSQIFGPINAIQHDMGLDIYMCLDDAVPKYVDDPRCTLLGRVVTPMGGKHNDVRREVHLEFQLGSTEITAFTLDVASGQRRMLAFEIARGPAPAALSTSVDQDGSWLNSGTASTSGSDSASTSTGHGSGSGSGSGSASTLVPESGSGADLSLQGYTRQARKALDRRLSQGAALSSGSAAPGSVSRPLPVSSSCSATSVLAQDALGVGMDSSTDEAHERHASRLESKPGDSDEGRRRSHVSDKESKDKARPERRHTPTALGASYARNESLLAGHRRPPPKRKATTEPEDSGAHAPKRRQCARKTVKQTAAKEPASTSKSLPTHKAHAEMAAVKAAVLRAEGKVTKQKDDFDFSASDTEIEEDEDEPLKGKEQ